MIDWPITEWSGCYDESITRSGLITVESSRHPAKMAKRLVERILRHGEAKGYWKPGDLLADPFGGIGSTGLMCSYLGYRSFSVELEPPFYRMAVGYDCPGVTKADWLAWRGHPELMKHLCPRCQSDGLFADGDTVQLDLFGGHERVEPHHYTGNFELNRAKWQQLGSPLPVMVQGDSRRFAQLVRDAQGAVTSPPYRGQREDGGEVPGSMRDPGGTQYRSGENYGASDGQIGAMKAGNIDGAVTSPPWVDARQDTTNSQRGSSAPTKHDPEAWGQPENIGNLPQGAITSPPWAGVTGEKQFKSDEERERFAKGQWVYQHGRSLEATTGFLQNWQGYGDTDGQIADLPTGDVDGAVTSPPYNLPMSQDHNGARGGERGSTPIEPGAFAKYGCTDGQIEGLSPVESIDQQAETYWSACRQVYAQLYEALQPGGVLAIVVKAYVQDGEIVDLPGQTAQLLQAIGFTVLEEAHAMLTKEQMQGVNLFSGETITRLIEHKSFFRHIYELRYPHNRIDYENVLFCRKGLL